MSKPPSIWATATAMPAVLLVLAPIAVTIGQAVRARQDWVQMFLRSPATLPLLRNTLGLTLCATAVATVLGTAAALLVVRTDVPLRRLWLALGAAPLAVPAFVASYTWVSISPAFEGFGGALLVVSGAYAPLVFLPAMAALRGLDPALEDGARLLGQRASGTLWRVVLPQLRPAVLGGMALVALNVLVEYGAFAMMRFHTFTTQIFLAFTVGLDENVTSALSVVLLALCLLVLAFTGMFDHPRRYARTSRGAARPQPVHALGSWRWPAALFLAALAATSVGVPALTLLYWLTQHGAASISPALASSGNVLRATLSSVGLGIGGALLTCALAFPLALLAARQERSSWVRLASRGAWMAQGLPGIVVALAFIHVAMHTLPMLYQTKALLLVAYAILFMSFALVSLRAALAQAPVALEEAARMLGHGRLGALCRVTVPLALPGIGAAAALVFTAVLSELTATLLLLPLGENTLATRVWQDISTLAFASAAPFAAVLIALSALGSWLAVRRFGAVAARAGAGA